MFGKNYEVHVSCFHIVSFSDFHDCYRYSLANKFVAVVIVYRFMRNFLLQLKMQRRDFSTSSVLS
jgi:hypothetical protein